MTTRTSAATERRSQTDRSRETRARLIAATLDCLVADGWAGTTTRSVAQRAGVSQGAQQHHFRTKRDLVDAALHHIVEELLTAAAGWQAPAAEAEQPAFVLDRLWEIHCLPLNLAVQELLTAGRTDPETGSLVEGLVADAEGAAVAAVQALMPGLSARPELADWVRTATATMRGIVAVSLDIEPASNPRWPAARRLLLDAAPR